MASPKLCVFCDNSSEEKIIIFTEEKLTKCKSTLNIRIKYGLKYREAVLPTDPTDIHGYHVQCYKCFSAINKKYLEEAVKTSELLSMDSMQSCTSSQEDLSLPFEMVKTEIQEDSIDISSQGVSESTDNDSCPQPALIICLFCERNQKIHNGKKQQLYFCYKPSLESNTKLFATRINDTNMLQKIDNSNEIFYHPACKVAYQNTYKSNIESIDTPWKNFHELAYNELCAYIDNEIIENKKSIFLRRLCTIYKNILIEISKGEVDVDDYMGSPQHLERKILKTYKTIKIVSMHHKRIVVPVENIPIDENVFNSLKEDDLLQTAALILREKLLTLDKNPLPDRFTITDIINGECSIPEPLNNFYSTLLGGSDQRQRESLHCIRQVKSLSQDAIYAVNNEQIKTSKHMVLGMALKNLTNNKKIIDVLNGYGHCCSYNVIEELESQLAPHERSEICADSILLESNLSTGVTLDNFDKYLEHSTRKDTLHDNYRIFIKSEIPGTEFANETSSEVSSDQSVEEVSYTETSKIQNSVSANEKNVILTGVIKQEWIDILEDQNMTTKDKSIAGKGTKRSFDEFILDIPTYPKRKKTD